MTAVFVSNSNRQVFEFSYRLPEHRRYFLQTIPICSQVKLTPDCSQQDIDALFEQWTKYGICRVERLGVRQAIPFNGLLISIGKPVPVGAIANAYQIMQDVKVAEGKRIRTEAALAMASTIEAQSKEIAKNYEISVAEEIPARGFVNPDDMHVAEGYRISAVPDGQGPPPPGPRIEQPSGRRRSRRAA
jgi:hypothetical protein